MPAAAKPKGMTMDVTVSCARGEGAAGQAERECFDCVSGETREQKTFREPGTRPVRSSRRRAVGALLHEGVLFPSLAQRGRGRRTSDEPRKWTNPFAAWMACVSERAGRSARGRGGRRARAASEEAHSAFVRCTVWRRLEYLS